MRVLTISQFERFCKKMNPERFIFSTVNQSKKNQAPTASMVVEYKTIFISLCPDLIIFKDERNTLCLRGVHKICLHDEMDGIGVAFTVICKFNSKEYKYVLTAF